MLRKEAQGFGVGRVSREERLWPQERRWKGPRGTVTLLSPLLGLSAMDLPCVSLVCSGYWNNLSVLEVVFFLSMKTKLRVFFSLLLSDPGLQNLPHAFSYIAGLSQGSFSSLHH